MQYLVRDLMTGEDMTLPTSLQHAEQTWEALTLALTCFGRVFHVVRA